MKILIILLLAIVVLYIIWQHQELKKFEVTHYTMHSNKIVTPMKVVVVSDLHSHVYGTANEELVCAVQQAAPDMILIPGDMIVSSHTEKYQIALDLLEKLVEIAPVYYSNGNHESRVAIHTSEYQEQFKIYDEAVHKLGVHTLNNQKQIVEHGANSIAVSGVEIPLVCYKKGKRVPLPQQYMEEVLGQAEDDSFQLLLAHAPAYATDYTAWGADLTVSGHTHGGLIRIPGIGSVFSPQFQFFPKYDAGEWNLDGHKIIVSRGLGTHTFNIRIFDRAELPVIELMPAQTQE